MTNRLTRLALLVAVALALHAVEAALPALPVPGARLGLANLATLIALVVLGSRAAITVAVVRSILGSAIVGTFLAPAFFMSLSGALVSAIVMAISYRLGPRFSLVGVSLAGALAHNMAQLAVAVVLIGYGVMAYAPYLIVFALPAGAVTGVLGAIVSERLTISLPGGDGR